MTDDKLMREEFEKWYGFEVCEDMDIQTDVAWRNWQVAWNAAIRACASECAMNDEAFAVFLELLMVSDPWPLLHEQKRVLEDFADDESRKRGYSDWIEAYHQT